MRSRLFWKRALVFGSPLACVALFACYDAPVQTPIPKTTQETKVRVAQNTKNKVDLLFLIDNSPSMAPKQAQLKARFPQLIAILDSFGTDNPADYQIGVVTSDLGAGQFNINRGQCHPGGDGAKLVVKGVAADTACAATLGGGVNFIKYNQLVKDAQGKPTSNLPANQDLATTFGCMASVGDIGCGFEAQLESVYKALHDPIPENAGFLRDDALLVVVFVTDEDDCSADPNTDLFDTSAAGMSKYGALLSYRCTQYSIACDAPGSTSPPVMLMPYGDSGGPLTGCIPADANAGDKLFDVTRYQAFFNQPKANGGVKVDPNDVILVGITAPEAPVSSILANVKAPVGPYVTCPGPIDPSGSGCAVVLQHSCIDSTNPAFFGDPAVRIRAVINSTINPMNRQNTSICDTSYQQALQGLGDIIVSSLKPGCLGSPVENPDTAPDCVVEDVSRNPDGTTTVSEIPWCGTNADAAAAASGVKPCWYLKTDPKCGVDMNGQPNVFLPGDPTPQQFGVSIVRPASGAPPNTTAQVSCSTLAVSATGM